MPRHADPRAWWQPWPWDDPVRLNLTVYEQESRRTGLVDQHGRELVHRREPIGFVRLKERP